MKLVMIRRVVGESMRPTLQPKQLILVSGWRRQFKPGQVVVIFHNGLEKIKRIDQIDTQRQQIFVIGDNADQSTDSRHFGWVSLEAVIAVVVWPRI